MGEKILFPQDAPRRGVVFRRFVVNSTLLTLPSLLVLWVVLELFFRFLIPGSNFPYTYSDPGEKILHFDPAGPREGIATRGNMAQQRGRWRINDAGWNSTLEYKSAESRGRPLIAIIGDSYVEGLNLDVDETLSAVLGERLGNAWEVYGFGMSGAPLSQYLNVSRYVARRFAPEIMVFVVLHNDFDESVANIERKPLFLQLSVEKDGVREIMPVAYDPSSVRRMVAKSALARYLWFNLRVWSLMDAYDPQRRRQQNFNANIDVEAVRQHREVIQRATDYVVSRIVRENPDVKVVFMMDGPRRDIYEDRLQSSNVLWLHEIQGQSCATYGASFIDLSEPLQDAYRRNKKKFNTEYDFHWNELGHEFAASILYDRLHASNFLRLGDSRDE